MQSNVNQTLKYNNKRKVNNSINKGTNNLLTFFINSNKSILSQCFLFGLPHTSEDLLSLLIFSEGQKGYIGSKPTLSMYGLHSLHRKFSGFHFLTSLYGTGCR